MLNELQKLAPDRDQGTLGNDLKQEQKFFGEFSGQTVDDPGGRGVDPE